MRESRRYLAQRLSAGLMGICILFSLLLSACSAGAGKEKEILEDLREKLSIAFQYLENMEYDSALDAFAQVIEIDEKQVDAYLGIARASSAQGRHQEARDYARKGYEATGNQTLAEMGDMYDQILENEDLLKETAALLEEGSVSVPEELAGGKPICEPER